MPGNSDELSQYECERLQNIKRNHEVLQSLGLDDQLRVAKAPRRRSSEPDPSAPTRMCASRLASSRAVRASLHVERRLRRY